MKGPNKTYPKQMLVLLAAIGLLSSVVQGAPTALTNGVPVTGGSGTIGSEKFYTITVPSGRDLLEIKISGGTGDCDLYVRKDSAPTLTNYDYRPYKVGNNETVSIEGPAAGTWYIMLRGYTTYANVTLVATHTASTVVKVLENSIPITGLSGAASSAVYYRFEVPAGQPKMEISIAAGSGDCDLYVKYGALPTTSDYDYRPFTPTNNEAVTVENPTAGTWYIMLRGYSGYAGVTLSGTYAGGVGVLLQNGIAVPNINGELGAQILYRIELPADQNNLEIVMSGGTGDCDMYIKHGTPPTLENYDYRPFLSGNDETVTILAPAQGPWYIMLHAYTAFTNLTLLGTFGNIVTLEREVPIENISGDAGGERFYKIDVPAGKSMLEIKIYGGTGNCDLYVKKGAKPTVSNWDYRPYLSGNSETVKIQIENKEPGTWQIMLRGRTKYSGVSLMADYWFEGSVTLLENGLARTNISGTEGSERYYRIIVSSRNAKLEFIMSGGTGDADLYVQQGSIPSITHYDYRPYLIGNDETVTIENPAADDYFVMIRGYHAYSGVSLVGRFGAGGGGVQVVQLTNAVPVTNLTGAIESEKMFKIDVPAGQAQLEIAITGGTGDCDMYLKKGSAPTATTWDYRPFLIGNNETVTIDNPEAASYYVMLKGYTAYANVTLKATYRPLQNAVQALSNGVPIAGLSGAVGSQKLYKIEVPTGQDTLTISIAGGTGDCDMYVKRGEEPTQSSWDYRPFVIGNNETVEVTNPAAATWYILLHAYQAYSGVTLTASYGMTFVGNNFSGDEHCVAVWNLEPGALTVDSVGGNTLNAGGSLVQSETTDFAQGVGSGRWIATNKATLYIRDADLDPDFPLKSGGSNLDISVCLWVKFDDLSKSSHVLWAKSAHTDGKRSFMIQAVRVSGKYHLRAVKGYAWGSNQETLTESDIALQTGRWYHVAVTWKNAKKEMNMVLWDDTAMTKYAQFSTLAYSVSLTDAHVELGTFDGTDGAPDSDSRLRGFLDEVVVFNDVLTEAEIERIRQGSYGK